MQKRPTKIHHINHLMHRHRRRVIAILITCFGLVALFIVSLLYIPTQQFNDEPNFTNPPTIPLGSQANTEPSTAPELKLEQENVTVVAGDNLSLIFDRLHISPQQLHAVSQIPLVKSAVKHLHAGQILQFTLDDKKQLVHLVLPISHTENIVVSKTDTGFIAKQKAQETNIATEKKQAVITSSFNTAGIKAKIPKKILANFAKIYSWKIDFSRDVHPGDKFVILYQLIKNLKTHKIEPGDIIAGSYTSKNNTLYAFRYRDNYGRENYYDAKGNSLRKAFIRKPINIGYISSPFSMHRMDPVLKKVRPHTGTDFAAPYGTPIHATGDGRIILRGRKGGYGRCIVINNGHHITTLFGHMSRFNPKYKVGSYVKMNDVIGYIGTSGWSTGPHVHYEYRINRRYENPMKVKLPNANPVPVNERKNYLTYVTSEKQKLTTPSKP